MSIEIKKTIAQPVDEDAKVEKETALYGRIVKAESIEGLDADLLKKDVQKWGERANGQAPREDLKWMIPQENQAKEKVPEFSRARTRTVSKAFEADYQHAVNAVEAGDRYVKVAGADGTKQVGILNTDGEKTGAWFTVDKDNRIREFAEMKDGVMNGRYASYNEDGKKMEAGYYRGGKPAGTFTQYNEQGNAVFKAEYDPEGALVTETAVDPKQASESKAKVKQHMEAKKGFKIGM